MNNLIQIQSSAACQRFDRFCRKFFKPYAHISLKDIFAWIRKGEIRVNGLKKPENYMLQLGDEVKIHPAILDQCVGIKEVKSNPAVIENWMKKFGYKRSDLILFEDKDWLIRNKPVGIVIHAGNKHTDDITMNELLDHYIKKVASRQLPATKWNKKLEAGSGELVAWETFKPSFAFRLDKDTSGVLVSAKTYPALQYINEIIRDHNISKEYFAWVEGALDTANFKLNDVQGFSKEWELSLQDGALKIDAPLFKWFNMNAGRAQSFVNYEKGIDSQTIVKTEKIIDDKQVWPLTLVKCKLLSGKMHQIRVHMAHIGHGPCVTRRFHLGSGGTSLGG